MRITALARSAAVAVTGVTLVATAAAAQAAPQSSPSEDQHCVIVLAKLRPGESSSRVLSRHCAESEEAADQKYRLADTSAQGNTLLVVLYQDRNYRGASTRIEGASACDRAGYGISDLRTWSNRVTSFKRFNFCQHVRAYDAPNYGAAAFGPWTADTPYVGSAANDRINSIIVRRL